jgi:hypothetical protein
MRTASDHLAFVIGLAPLGACGTYTTYQTAEPLAPGRWQASIAISPGVFVDRPSAVRTPTSISELAVRRGVGGETDVGLKLFTAGAEVSVRHRIIDAQWQWAVLGALVYARSEEDGGTTEALMGQLRLTTVATRRVSERWAFSLGPVVTGSAMTFGGGGNAMGLLVGAFANAAWTFGGARRWHLIPEVSLHGTLSGDVPVDGFVTLLGVAIARDF